MARKEEGSNERLIVQILGGIVLICLGGIIAEDIFVNGGTNDALLTIGSLAAGALASRISQKDQTGNVGSRVEIQDQAHGRRNDEDDFAVIGRAATKSIIAEAMRQMGQPPSAPDPDVPKT